MDQYTPTSPPMKRRKSTTSTPVVEYAATIHMQPGYQPPPPLSLQSLSSLQKSSTKISSSTRTDSNGAMKIDTTSLGLTIPTKTEDGASQQTQPSSSSIAPRPHSPSPSQLSDISVTGLELDDSSKSLLTCESLNSSDTSSFNINRSLSVSGRQTYFDLNTGDFDNNDNNNKDEGRPPPSPPLHAISEHTMESSTTIKTSNGSRDSPPPIDWSPSNPFYDDFTQTTKLQHYNNNNNISNINNSCAFPLPPLSTGVGASSSSSNQQQPQHLATRNMEMGCISNNIQPPTSVIASYNGFSHTTQSYVWPPVLVPAAPTITSSSSSYSALIPPPHKAAAKFTTTKQPATTTTKQSSSDILKQEVHSLKILPRSQRQYSTYATSAGKKYNCKVAYTTNNESGLLQQCPTKTRPKCDNLCTKHYKLFVKYGRDTMEGD